MRIFSWLIRAFIFFTLFAFALNNQHAASVHWFFGVQWRAPMVFVVLAAFAAGCALGAAAMLPGWWKGRKLGNAGDNGASNSSAHGAANSLPTHASTSANPGDAADSSAAPTGPVSQPGALAQGSSGPGPYPLSTRYNGKGAVRSASSATAAPSSPYGNDPSSGLGI